MDVCPIRFNLPSQEMSVVVKAASHPIDLPTICCCIASNSDQLEMLSRSYVTFLFFFLAFGLNHMLPRFSQQKSSPTHAAKGFLPRADPTLGDVIPGRANVLFVAAKMTIFHSHRCDLERGTRLCVMYQRNHTIIAFLNFKASSVAKSRSRSRRTHSLFILRVMIAHCKTTRLAFRRAPSDRFEDKFQNFAHE